MNKDSTEFFRLYDELSELMKKIDEFARESREESEKNASPWYSKKTWRWVQDEF